MAFFSRLLGRVPLAPDPPPPVARQGLLPSRAFLDALADPAILLDDAGAILEANDSARRFLPNLRDGAPLSSALRVPDVLDAAKRVIGGGDAVAIEYLDRVPVERWTEAQIGALRSGLPRSGARALILLRDLTPVRRAERMRADFVANASHELRTPLASLLGFVETLQGPARDDPAARTRFLEIMRLQAMRMARLIDDLLSLSRIELRAHMPPDDAVDLVGVARQVVDALSELAADRGIALSVRSGTPSLVVRGDRDELIRVIENLIENAIKYGGSGGRVAVDLLAADGAEASVAVRDFGAGIAPEHLPRLTERFYRIDIADSRDKGGTGLGLALVKHIVARHRGRLDIASTLGEGATFTVFLPLDPKEPRPATAATRHRTVIDAS